MTKRRMIFDIANFSGQPSIMGVPRYVLEVLRRLVDSGRFEITTICSLPEEEHALRNFRRFFPVELPFQSKDVECFEPAPLPGDGAPERSRWRRLEDTLRDRFPDNRILNALIGAARTVKWTIAKPPFLTERDTSPFYERLVRESDVYFSPFHPLIPELAADDSIRKVLVVHDLIPLLFADLYKDHRFFQKNPWESITSDVLVFADSESTKRDLLEYYPNVSPEQVSVALLGVDERFKPCDDRAAIDRALEKYGVPASAPYIFSVATLDIRKNFDHVMRCFVGLLEEDGDRFANLRLVLTGTRGWRDRTFRKVYGALPRHVKDRIVFTGYVEDDDLPLLYAGAACFCYMSLYEGFGLPPLEAMRCGTPVVASNNSSLPEVVGDAGILLDARDEAGLIRAFRELLSDPARRRERIDRGIERASRFTWDRCVETILEKLE